MECLFSDFSVIKPHFNLTNLEPTRLSCLQPLSFLSNSLWEALFYLRHDDGQLWSCGQAVTGGHFCSQSHSDPLIRLLYVRKPQFHCLLLHPQGSY